MAEKNYFIDKDEKDPFHNDKLFYALIGHMVFFPKFMFLGLPALIFISLFFVPENYPGILPYPHSIEGKYQNRWLFDMVGFYGILLYSSALIKHFTVGMPERFNQFAVDVFFMIKNDNFKEFIMWSRWIRAYFTLVVMIVTLFFGNLLVFGEANNDIGCHGGGSKFCLDSRTWNGSAGANFFFICIWLFIIKIVCLYFMMFFLIVSRELDKK